VREIVRERKRERERKADGLNEANEKFVPPSNNVQPTDFRQSA